MTTKNTSVPYIEEPKINFFIYPPMKDTQTISIETELELNKEMSPSNSFTIYISIPYCRKKCHSCCCFRGFLPIGVDKDSFLDEYVTCLLKQLSAYANTPRFQNSKCAAIYIGGGTASLLSTLQVELIISHIMNNFNCIPKIEINLEGNPIDFNLEYLQSVRRSGVNRLSIGYQSGFDSSLRALNCSHTSRIGYIAVQNAMQCGFQTVNVDLLYNIPGQSFEMWKEDLCNILKLSPQSISAGDYQIFPGSTAEKLLKEKKLAPQHSLEVANEWYQWTVLKLKEFGYFEHIRGIFVKPGHIQQYVTYSCNHSCEILGIGSGAYSFINGIQFTNTFDSTTYKKQIMNGNYFMVCSRSSKSTIRNLMERFVIHNFYSFTLSRIEFRKRFNIDPLLVFPEIFSKLKEYGLIEITEESVILTNLGRKWRRNVYYEFHSIR